MFKELCCCTDHDKSIQVRSDFHISCLHFHPRLVKLDLQVFSLPRPKTSVASSLDLNSIMGSSNCLKCQMILWIALYSIAKRCSEWSNCRGLLKISNKNLNIERDKSQSNGYLLPFKKVCDTMGWKYLQSCKWIQ